MRILTLGLLLMLSGTYALAQSEFKPAMSLGQGSGPIKIEADALEVQDKNKMAAFIGNVVVRRNDVTIRAREMNVYYAGGTQPGDIAAATGGTEVKRIEMKGKVLFVQKDQQATGDRAVYEKAAELLTLTGNVVLTQGQSVAKGQKLVINMRSGRARLEGRPNMILVPEETGSSQ